MKSLLNGALHSYGKFIAKSHLFFMIAAIVVAALFSSCEKELAGSVVDDVQSKSRTALNPDGNVVDNYSGLPAETSWELQQARAATARYRDVKNAIKDGYVDIAVDVEGMGHHYMKTSIVDGTFDLKEPEILVYNRDDNGMQQLVAVEYAVPLTNPMPEGFSGAADVWNGTSGFPLWLLHAWVWSYNPDGVFNWTNPLVHLN